MLFAHRSVARACSVMRRVFSLYCTTICYPPHIYAVQRFETAFQAGSGSQLVMGYDSTTIEQGGFLNRAECICRLMFCASGHPNTSTRNH